MQINLFRKSGAAITTSTEVNCKNTVTPAHVDSNCRGDYIIVSLLIAKEILNIVVVNHYIHTQIPSCLGVAGVGLWYQISRKNFHEDFREIIANFPLK